MATATATVDEAIAKRQSRGCDAAGKAVASNIVDSQFVSLHQYFLL